MGFNGIVASCIHTFPGTDIPIATTGDMIMIIGSLLVAATLVVILYPHLVRGKGTKFSSR